MYLELKPERYVRSNGEVIITSATIVQMDLNNNYILTVKQCGDMVNPQGDWYADVAKAKKAARKYLNKRAVWRL